MVNRLKKRSTAILLTILLVLLSVPLGAKLSLESLRFQAEEVYQYGESGWGGIGSDLYELRWDSEEMLELARGYLSADDADILAVAQSLDSLDRRAEDSPASDYVAVNRLLDAVKTLDSRLRAEPLSDAEQTQRSELSANISACEYRIAESTYNDAANGFNATLQQFPANMLSKIVGVQPLELYA